MAISLDILDLEKNHLTEKKVFENPYKEILSKIEDIEKLAIIIPEDFINKNNIPPLK